MVIVLALCLPLRAAETITTVSIDTWGVMSQGKMACLDYHYATTTIFWAEIALVTLSGKTRTVAIPTDNTLPYYISYGFDNNHLVYIPYLSTGSGGGGGGGGTSGSGGRTCYIYDKNISTGVIRQISISDKWKETVWLKGNLAVWADYRYWDSTTVDSVNSEIYMYDLAANQERRITSDHAWQGEPFTDGSRLVWIDYAQAYGRLFMYDVAASTTVEIAAYSAAKDDPRIDGNSVVWVDYRNATLNPHNSDIYLYNRSTSTTTVVCNATGYQGNPFVSGNWIVWEDFRNATGTDSLNADIYGYRIDTGISVPLVVAAGYQGHPTINNDTLCWFDMAGTSMTLKMANISTTTGVINPHTIQIRSIEPTDKSYMITPTGRAVHGRKMAAGVYLENGKTGSSSKIIQMRKTP